MSEEAKSPEARLMYQIHILILMKLFSQLTRILSPKRFSWKIVGSHVVVSENAVKSLEEQKIKIKNLPYIIDILEALADV